MGYLCNGICTRQPEASKKINYRKEPHRKYCSACAIAYKTDAIRCICCNAVLRGTPSCKYNNKRWKAKLAKYEPYATIIQSWR